MNPLPTAAWGAALAALLLAGCASREALVPQVRQDVAADGAKTVSVAPERLACERVSRCPALAASWSSARSGQAVLAIGLPGTASPVTGADVHIGGSEVVRLRSAGQADVRDGMSRFDVPLRLVDRLAYGQRVWMRLYTADGAGVNEYVNGGEQGSRAAEAMAHFLTAVQKAGGTGAGVQGSGGGLLDRLGAKDK